MNFYLSTVDGILKTEQDNPSIGLLLCKSKNDLVAEYSLKDMSTPIGVSEYRVTCNLPRELENSYRPLRISRSIFKINKRTALVWIKSGIYSVGTTQFGIQAVKRTVCIF